MTHPKRARRRGTRGEQGYVLIMTALLIVPLVVFTGFGVDLGSWYAQAAREQRSVDAASLAGVVQLPNQTNAKTAALASLKANGYSFSSCASGTTVNSTNECAFDFPSSTGQEMTVTLWQPANIYFAGAAGLHSQSLTRDATAIYNLHIPLGSPTNTFGNDPTRSGTQPNLWAAIQGPFSRHQDGDPYSTMCSGDTETYSTCDGQVGSGGSPYPAAKAQNTSYSPDGYIWAVDVPAADVGQTISVQIYDPAASNTGSPLYESVGNDTGDFETSYELFKTTSSALVSEDPSLSLKGLCASGPGQQTFGYGNSSGSPYYTSSWFNLCTFTPTVAGIYPIQVKTSNIANVLDAGTGWNVYSVKATTGAAAQPQVYALNDMSIWTPAPGSTASFYLANIGSQYAGHTLVVDLYDPGDGTAGSTPFTMQFLGPPTTQPSLPVTWPYTPVAGSSVGCNYNATGSSTIGPATPNWSSTCTITTLNAGSSSGIYNGLWLRVSIQIPSSATYTCTTDCWWTIKYSFGNAGAPTDRTTWVVNVLGDPVHLVN